MLNQHQKRAIKIQNWLYFYMCELPLIWNTDQSAVIVQAKPSILRGYSFGLINVVVIVLASVYDLISSYILQRPDYSIGIASLHLIGLIILLIMIALICCFIRNMEFLTGTNLLIKEHTIAEKQGKLPLNNNLVVQLETSIVFVLCTDSESVSFVFNMRSSFFRTKKRSQVRNALD